MGRAAFAVGAFAGFLFGIPRYAAQPATTLLATQAVAQTTGTTSINIPPASPLYASNTNLEQVSDWLTKIILGATLMQVTKLPHFLRQIREYITLRAPCNNASDAFAVGYIIYIFGVWVLFELPDDGTQIGATAEASLRSAAAAEVCLRSAARHQQ